MTKAIHFLTAAVIAVLGIAVFWLALSSLDNFSRSAYDVALVAGTAFCFLLYERDKQFFTRVAIAFVWYLSIPVIESIKLYRAWAGDEVA